MLDDAYSARMLALAGDIPSPTTLPEGVGPTGSATRRARLCGSRLTAHVRMEGDRIAALAQHVETCALGRASASIVARNASGADLAELEAAREAASRTLATGTPPDVDALPGDKWSDIALLATLKDYPARHGSVLLAFEAALEAARAAADADAA